LKFGKQNFRNYLNISNTATLFNDSQSVNDDLKLFACSERRIHYIIYLFWTEFLLLQGH